MTTPEENIATVARREVAMEISRALIDAKKVQIYAERNRKLKLPFWSRLLPFTITWKHKS